MDEKKIKEDKMIKSLAKAFGVENLFEEIEAKKQKETALLESLNKTLMKLSEPELKQVEEVFVEPMQLFEEPIVEPEIIVEMGRQPEPELPKADIVSKSVMALSKTNQQDGDIQKVADKLPDGVQKELDIIKKSIADFHRFAQRHSQMGGGGEVNLRYLDDINRSSIADGLYLRYDAPTKKFIFDRGHHNNFYGAFQSTVTQTSGASTATALTYNVVDFSYGVTVANNSQVVLQYPGLYNAQFSVQLKNTGTAIDPVYIWLRQNGTDVVGSAGKIDVPSKHGAGDGAILIGWNFYVNTVVANEYFEFMWFAADDTHVTIAALPAQAAVNGVSPAIPSTASVVLTVSPV